MSEPPRETLGYAQAGGQSSAGLGVSVASLVVGILSIPLDVMLMAGVATGLVGLILGIVGMRRAGQRSTRMLAVAGVVLSGLAMLVGIGCGVILFNA
jgi:hypothetical protein